MKSKKILAVISVILLLTLTVMPAAVSAGKYGPDMKVDADTWDRKEGDAEYIIDRDESTMWHSLWDVNTAKDYGFEEAVGQENVYPQIAIVEFDNVYTLDCIGYLARSNSGNHNGIVLEYEFWASETGTVADLQSDEGWTMVASGTWTENEEEFVNDVFKNVEFDATKAKSIKLKVLKGVGGWASCAELQFGFTDVAYTPMYGFTPRTAAIPMPTEATEAPTTTEAQTKAEESPTETAAADVTEAPTTTAAAEDDSGNSTTIIIVIVIAAVVVIAVVVVLAAKNKGKK